MDKLVDMFGRTIGDVRISVTDRCNLRCTYCIDEDFDDWLPREGILTFEEITRLVRILHGFGVRTLRLTGGEPLMRRELHTLVRMLHELDPGLDLSLTTNGVFLREQAPALAAAGLRRINVSLDTLRRDRFAEVTRRDALPQVLDGLVAARDAGLEPIKLNTVAMRGCNDDEIVELVAFGRDNGYQVRFIEYMPLDGGHHWTKDDVFGKREILQIVGDAWPFEPAGVDEHEPAQRFRFLDGTGEFGVIGSVTEPFCDHCDRIRITADGQLRTCLFSLAETDLRALVRGGVPDQAIAEVFRSAVVAKEKGHRIGSRDFVQPARPMIAIGG